MHWHHTWSREGEIILESIIITEEESFRILLEVQQKEKSCSRTWRLSNPFSSWPCSSKFIADCTLDSAAAGDFYAIKECLGMIALE